MLQERFHYIRSTFFPQWDRKKEWKVKHPSTRHVHGYCNIELKTVEVGILFKDTDDMDKLLIHEICHAYYGCVNHGILWRRVFEKRARIAESIGRINLAEKIRREIDAYNQPEPYGDGRSETYNLIENLVLENPSISYKEVLDCIAYEFGLSPDEIDTQFKKSKQIFEKAKRRYKFLSEKPRISSAQQ